jgi:hypothetical protein
MNMLNTAGCGTNQLSAPQFVSEMQMLFSLQNHMKSPNRIAITMVTYYLSAAKKHRIVSARFQNFSLGV